MPKRTPEGVKPERTKEAVGRRLRQLRAVLELQAKALAEAAGVQQNTWSQWETGTRMADLHAMMRVWDVTGADLNFIFLGRTDTLPTQLAAKLAAREPAPPKNAVDFFSATPRRSSARTKIEQDDEDDSADVA